MSYYEEVYCHACGNQVCQTCGCCYNNTCEMGCCPIVEKENVSKKENTSEKENK